MSRVSGLDKLDAIEILASTTKIQAVGKIQKNARFSSPGKCEKVYCLERLYYVKVGKLSIMNFLI